MCMGTSSRKPGLFRGRAPRERSTRVVSGSALLSSPGPRTPAPICKVLFSLASGTEREGFIISENKGQLTLEYRDLPVVAVLSSRCGHCLWMTSKGR